MGKGKKRKCQTPHRKSTRVKKRSVKGVYYDEHFVESTSPTAANINDTTNDKEYNALEMTGDGHVKPIAASTVECTTPVANEPATPYRDVVVLGVSAIPAVHSRRSEEPGIAPDTATPTIPSDVPSEQNLSQTATPTNHHGIVQHNSTQEDISQEIDSPTVFSCAADRSLVTHQLQLSHEHDQDLSLQDLST